MSAIRFAIVLDDKVISAPVIREPITGGRGQISGSFTAQPRNRPRGAAARRRAAGAADGGRGAQRRPRARRRQHPRRRHLAGRRLRARHRLHGASSTGCSAGSRTSRCVVNLILHAGASCPCCEATLTLPGMAGILLTLGMAVDANILINERIREEVRNGPHAARRAGDRVQPRLRHDLRQQRDGVPGACHAVRLRLRPGARLRRDHHRRHRDHAVHRHRCWPGCWCRAGMSRTRPQLLPV